MADAVLLEERDRVAWVTLNRPRALNAIDESVLAELPRVIDGIDRNEGVKAVVVTGAGDTFCVGLDIDLLERAFEDSKYFRDVLDRLKHILLGLESLPVPVIAAVNGTARAGGFELMLACDFVLAAEDARIGDTHLQFGIVPGGGATQRAPRKLGWQRAAQLILTGKWIDGRDAERIGLALKAMPGDELVEAATQLALSFTNLSRATLAATKAAMLVGIDLPPRVALDEELDIFMRYLDEEPTAREGFRAWMEKRPPAWPCRVSTN